MEYIWSVSPTTSIHIKGQGIDPYLFVVVVSCRRSQLELKKFNEGACKDENRAAGWRSHQRFGLLVRTLTSDQVRIHVAISFEEMVRICAQGALDFVFLGVTSIRHVS